jgi:hypothetical protein
MLAAQMIATHDAMMDCIRRAQIPEQTFDGRQMNLNHANKLARTCAALVEALDGHRGRGQQLVRVEHVHVHCLAWAALLIEPGCSNTSRNEARNCRWLAGREDGKSPRKPRGEVRCRR